MTDPLSRYHALIPHPERAAILVLPDGTLPCLVTTEEVERNVAPLNDFVKTEIGLHATTLRCVRFEYDRETRIAEGVLLMECHPPLPEGLRWVAPDEISGPSLGREAIALWQAETAVPNLRSKWAQPGWLDATQAWIAQALATQGITPSEPLRQQRTWSITSMLVQPTDQGDFYVKATHPMFGQEPALTYTLYQQFPDHIPQVVAFDSDRHLLLMSDFHGVSIKSSQRLAQWEGAVRTYARLQRELESQVGALRSLGCWDRGLEFLTSQLDPLIEDREPMLIGERRGLTVEELDQLRALCSRLGETCKSLAGIPVPLTLIHGDFHANNVALSGGTPIFFDWSDGSISHPFVDLISMFEEQDLLPPIPGLREQLTEIYLSHWQDCAPIADLRAALALAEPVAMLNMAVSYRHIYHNTEQAARWELAGALSFWLRKLIQHFD